MTGTEIPTEPKEKKTPKVTKELKTEAKPVSTPMDRVNDAIQKVLKEEDCQIEVVLDYKPGGIIPVIRIIDNKQLAEQKKAYEARLAEEKDEGKN